MKNLPLQQDAITGAPTTSAECGAASRGPAVKILGGVRVSPAGINHYLCNASFMTGVGGEARDVTGHCFHR